MRLTEWLVAFVDEPDQISWPNTGSACFIWHFVNPIETETGPDQKLKQKGGLFTLGCSLFARFSVSTVRLEPSEKTTTKRKQPPFLFVVNE